MNKANKSIGWTNYTWNPIKGICPVGCWYCYARKIYKRFKMDPKLSWDGKVPILSNKKPSKIFVCSTIEMFHPQIPKEWRDRIFRIIKNNPQHTFQILTKMPENIDREMPDNVWLGLTITGEHEISEHAHLNVFKKAKAKVKFVSYEPILGCMPFDTTGVDWIILGRLTGHGHGYDPRLNDIAVLKFAFWESDGIPIFMKDNLKERWGKKLIQEWPE